jgi:serine/threonine protein phosphatase PrpC
MRRRLKAIQSNVWQVSGAGLTHRGKVRQRNEDSLLLDQAYCNLEQTQPVAFSWPAASHWMVAVADGLGGHNAGERASREVIEGLAACREHTVAEVTHCLHSLNARLQELSDTQSDLYGLGAAVAGMFAGPDGLHAFNVGDCRAYLQRDRFLVQLTADDSLAQLLVDTGQYPRNQKRHPRLNILTQSVGGRPMLMAIEPHIIPVTWTQPGRFLVCSDGLTDMLTLEDLESAMANDDDLATAAGLSEGALEAGGRDNITLAVCSFRPGPGA